MIPEIVKCKNCSAEIEVGTFRTFLFCPYCETRTPFKGFVYRRIDPQSSMYAHVKHWADCPACRGRYMFLGPSGKTWKCPDCGYHISDREMKNGVFWFCDDCEAFLNVQADFTTENGTWKCTECGCVSGVTEENIL